MTAAVRHLSSWSIGARPACRRRAATASGSAIGDATGARARCSKTRRPGTRRSDAARRMLAAASRRGERVLLGFDFPFGYPAGFAARLGLAGAAVARRLGRDRRLLADDERQRQQPLRRRRRAQPARLAAAAFPFWGCPAASRRRTSSAPKHHRPHDGDGLAEQRLIDRCMCRGRSRAGSCRHGLGRRPGVDRNPGRARAARRSALGRRRARSGRSRPGSRAARRTGASSSPRSIRRWCRRAAADWRSQGRGAGAHRRRASSPRVDDAGELAALFAGDPGLTPERARRVETEEAWTLGVTARSERQPVTQPSPPRVSGADSCLARKRARGLVSPPASGRGRRSRASADAATTISAIRPRSTRRSFALIRAEADLARFPRRCGRWRCVSPMPPAIPRSSRDLVWSRGAVAAGRSGARRRRADPGRCGDGGGRHHRASGLPAEQRVICTLGDPAVAGARARSRHDALGRRGRAVAAASRRRGRRDRQRADRAVSSARDDRRRRAQAGAGARLSRSALSAPPRRRRRWREIRARPAPSSRSPAAAAAARSPPRRSTRLLRERRR